MEENMNKSPVDKIFDLEQSILRCWGVVDDLNLLYEQALEREKPFTPDEWANLLLGMKELYHLKFDECFRDFEVVCRRYHMYKKHIAETQPLSTDEF